MSVWRWPKVLVTKLAGMRSRVEKSSWRAKSPATARRVSATVRGWVKKFLYDASCLGFSGRCCFPGKAGAPPVGRPAGVGVGGRACRSFGGQGGTVPGSRGRTNGWMGLILGMWGFWSQATHRCNENTTECNANMIFCADPRPCVRLQALRGGSDGSPGSRCGRLPPHRPTPPPIVSSNVAETHHVPPPTRLPNHTMAAPNKNLTTAAEAYFADLHRVRASATDCPGSRRRATRHRSRRCGRRWRRRSGFASRATAGSASSVRR